MQPSLYFLPQHHPSRSGPSLAGHRTAVRRWLRALLAVPLISALGCGTLGGLPSASPALPGHTVPPAVSPAKPATNASSVSPARSTTPATNGNPPAAAAVVAAAYHGEHHEATTGLAGPAASASIQDQEAICQACGITPQSGMGCGCGAPAAQATYRNAQEYIFDGGDQQPTVIIKNDWSAEGVEPSDTVVYYETLAGSVCVQPTNRVPIYAPRFGAIRQVSGLQLSTHAASTQRILAPLSVERFDEKNLAGTMVLPVAPHGEQQVGLIDAFQENNGGTPMEQVQPLYGMSAARVPFELIDPRRTGQITTTEVVALRQFIQNAQTWVNPESLAVEVSNQAAILLKDTKAPQDLFVYELPDKCSMRIFKAASHTIANSGDIVSFSIRFDNAGVKPLGNAVIIDSLAPRLSYIQGSQQCSVGVRFSAEPNEVGSMVLRWEIEEPLESGDGGTITFDCRVR